MNYMNTSGSDMDRKGAATLVNVMSEDLWRDIAFWQRAVKGDLSRMSEAEKETAKRTQKWYGDKQWYHAYRMKDWKMPPEYTKLFEEFRNDLNYHFKNMVEMMMRDVITEYLEKTGKSVKVYLTSDTDDVLGGVDLIVEVQKNGKRDYFGIDIAISENNEYLGEKGMRTKTKCNEFFALKKSVGLNVPDSIPRMVFAIPNRIMSPFVKEYMKGVTSSEGLKKWEALERFQNAFNTGKRHANVTVADYKSFIEEQILHILH